MTRYTELQISSDLLDQPDFLGKPKKVFICSTPRSGSYLLCRYMINAGLGVPHEYFNPVVIQQIVPRLGFARNAKDLKWSPRGRRDRLGLRRGEREQERDFLQQYIEFLTTRRCQAGVLAAKIHYRDFARVLDNQVGQELLAGGLFVFLYREDMLKQAVSEHFAQLTGQWGIDDAVTTAPKENPNFFDYEAIDHALLDLSEQERGWRVYMARHGITPMSISYEKLCQDPFAFVEAIACRLGIDPATLRRGYSESASASEGDPAIPSKGEAVRRYLAAARSRDPWGRDGKQAIPLRLAKA
ncbi:MAG TPA: Stf0 family sulfotransferase [Rhodopila sp.]|uniref:Stf0 family sulfotransferase n=1 Tax=Rhodopila sp. TaxID=2480087 RepID=UPI002B6D8746|nr:Stf0 family sulfotransferase [Rhodopila sp.]HVY14530.1 Stf0 family sulfotransferase [Rhodopila sp.]